MHGFEGAIQQLAHSGFIDRDKVGIVGFSRTGWYVEYMLTHSRFPITAAEVADNMDASYVQYILSDVGLCAELESDNGARPFGEGLETWIRRASGFNVDKIHTPLRMEIDTRPLVSIVGFWELFSVLRYLGKPVDLTVIPDIEEGVHILQNPQQRLVSEGETVDWFCFWLKGEEDENPDKAAEFARWRILRQLQKHDERRSAGTRMVNETRSNSRN
jgi:dipeptidyl aminopeptidase/acylaminoacyl peptidase